MSCDRCGADIAPFFLELYDPPTRRRKTLMMCSHCMTWAFELTENFAKGGQR